jgi:hypothetical protein
MKYLFHKLARKPEPKSTPGLCGTIHLLATGGFQADDLPVLLYANGPAVAQPDKYDIAQQLRLPPTRPSKPKSGSWLNQIELDFSALSRQCLNRRIPTQAQLAYQVYCWSRERQTQAVKIRWPFTPEQARQTLNSQYRKVNKTNKHYAQTS